MDLGVISTPHAGNLNIPIGILRFLASRNCLDHWISWCFIKSIIISLFSSQSREFSCSPKNSSNFAWIQCLSAGTRKHKEFLRDFNGLRPPFLPRTPGNWKFLDFPGIPPNLVKFRTIAVNLVKLEDFYEKGWILERFPRPMLKTSIFL